MSFLSRLTHPARIESPELETPEQIDAFIDSRSLEYPTKLEDDFVKRALGLGVDGGMILDVGTRVGLIPLKMLWQNENYFAIGMDRSSAMIDRARATAAPATGSTRSTAGPALGWLRCGPRGAWTTRCSTGCGDPEIGPRLPATRPSAGAGIRAAGGPW